MQLVSDRPSHPAPPRVCFPGVLGPAASLWGLDGEQESHWLRESGREGWRPGTALCAGAAGPGSPPSPSNPRPAWVPAQELVRRAEEKAEKQTPRGRAQLAANQAPGAARCCGH